LVDCLLEQCHPSLHGVKQNDSEIQPTVCNDEAGNTATRAQIKDPRSGRNARKGSDELLRVLDVIANRAGTKNSQGSGAFEHLRERLGHDVAPGTEDTMAPPVAGPS
jgi:hypothetical protein